MRVSSCSVGYNTFFFLGSSDRVASVNASPFSFFKDSIVIFFFMQSVAVLEKTVLMQNLALHPAPEDISTRKKVSVK